MSSHRRNLGAALVAMALTVGLPGCGGGGGGGNPVAPTITQPPAPTRTTLPTQTFSGLDEGEVQRFELTLSPSANSLELVADWTSPGNDIDIFVTSTSCTTSNYNDLLNQRGSCSNIGRGISVTKPERLTMGALAAGNYNVFVGSSGLSRSRESGTLAITVVR